MELSLVILFTFLASFVGTVTGFGTSTILIPVMALFLPFTQTLLFVGIVHWFGDVWKIIFFKKGINIKLIVFFGIPGILASYFAAKIPVILSVIVLQKALGLFLITYVLFLIFEPRWKIKPSNLSAFWGGIFSGIASAVFGVGGAIRSTFLSSFNLPKSVFLFTSGVIGILIDSSRLVQYTFSGVELTKVYWYTLIGCIPVSLLGALVAKKLLNKVPQKSFRFVVAIGIMLAGLRYLLLN